MAQRLNIYLAGQLAQSFPKKSGIKIGLNYDRDRKATKKKVVLTGIVWSRENLDIINAWIDAGIAGTGPGISEGIPLALRLQIGNQPEYEFFNGYLDLMAKPNLSRKIKAQVEVRERDSVDFLNDTTDSKDFKLLYELPNGAPGKISDSDFVSVPYVLNSVPNYREAMMGLLSVYILTEQIKQAIQALIELAAEMANPFEATAIIRAVLRVAYLVILVAAIVKMIKDTVQLVIQPVKYHKCMSLLEQLRKGAEAFGYTFRCPILEAPTWNTLHTMPEKLKVPVNPSDDRLLGITTPNQIQQYGYYKGTVGDLFRAAQKLIRGKYQVLPNGELWLVREDQNTNVPQYVIPDVRQDYYTHNADELRSNYFIEFLIDNIDKNTIQQYQGTTFQVLCRQAVPGDIELMKGFERVTIPFALAKRKEELTVPEKIIKGLLDTFDTIINGLISAVNAVINVYNEVIKVINSILNALSIVGIDIDFELQGIPTLQPVTLGTLIENRIGMLMIEQDQIGVPKLMLLDVNSNPKLTKLNALNATTLTAQTTWRLWHGPVVSMVPSPGKPYGNQAIIKVFSGVPFSQQHFQQLLYNNKCFDYSGNPAEIDDLLYDIDKQAVDITARFSQKIGLNLIENYSEPDGQ